VTRFRYRPERSHLGTIYRPVATVIVEHKKIVIELPLYIDSERHYGSNRPPKTALEGLEESPGEVFHILSGVSLSFSGEAKSLLESRRQ
jgi:hypothetical protein